MPYEQRLEQDIHRIRTAVSEVAHKVEKAVQNSLRAVLTLDHHLAYETILGDKPINRAIEDIDRLCHYFVARHLPSAGHLRFISSVLRMNIELERVGDYAATISREAAQLSRPLPPPLRKEVERMGKNASQMLHQALQACAESNADLAKATMYGDLIERSFAAAFDELVRHSEKGKRSARDAFGILVILNMLERIGDQAVNLCEEVVFAVTGEARPRPVYRILFLDKTNESLGPMAVSIARKAFPNSGIYRTAARRPAGELDPAFLELLQEIGNTFEEKKPQPIDWVPEEWNDYDVIVSLQGSMTSYLPAVPFRTVALEWEVGSPPGKKLDAAERRKAFEALYKDVAARIRNLMETLQGEDAS